MDAEIQNARAAVESEVVMKILEDIFVKRGNVAEGSGEGSGEASGEASAEATEEGHEGGALVGAMAAPPPTVTTLSGGLLQTVEIGDTLHEFKAKFLHWSGGALAQTCICDPPWGINKGSHDQVWKQDQFNDFAQQIKGCMHNTGTIFLMITAPMWHMAATAFADKGDGEGDSNESWLPFTRSFGFTPLHQRFSTGVGSQSLVISLS